MTEKIAVGFIPLVDAASLLAAADFGFAENEGLAVELIREASWANVREKLSVGIFDAAHMLAPMAVASALGVMPGEAFTAPYALATNGNAITVGPALLKEIETELADTPLTPQNTAHALKQIALRRKRDGLSPLTFGSTFPFSCHTYLLRYWMAAGGLDTACDLRLIVLPPPYMVESLKRGEVDGFCVGAPWNSVAADLGYGRILHFGCEIVSRLTEKVLAVRGDWAQRHQDTLIKLMRAVSAAAIFVRDPENWTACCERFSARDRIGVNQALIERTLSGTLKLGLGGESRGDARYLLLSDGANGCPDDTHAAWFYSQMRRWDQIASGGDRFERAKAVFSSDLFSLAFGSERVDATSLPHALDGLGAFAGPSFDKDAIGAYLSALP